MAYTIGKGTANVSKMYAILTDSHHGSRTKVCVLINVVVPKLEYAGEIWEGNATLVKQLEAAQMTGAKNMLVCSRTRRKQY